MRIASIEGSSPVQMRIDSAPCWTSISSPSTVVAPAAAAAASSAPNFKPAILTVEVMGFGERNCKETDKDCFAK